MNFSALNKRVDDLSKKLVEEPKEHVARFDDDSFTEAEKALFLKIKELMQQYGSHLPPDVLEANKDLIWKGSDILMKYTIGTFRVALLCLVGNPESQRDKNLFDLFFYNFLLDLMECLKEANKQPQSEEDFQRLFEKYDLFAKITHLARKNGIAEKMQKRSDDLEKTEYTEEVDNEHYDRV